MERAGAGWDQHWEEIRACLLSWWKGLCFPKQLTANGLITLPMCSHTDSSHGATFPGMQTATQALSVTSFSIFILCKVMTIPSGARVCPRPDEGTRFCHKNIFLPDNNRPNEKCWKKRNIKLGVWSDPQCSTCTFSKMHWTKDWFHG